MKPYFLAPFILIGALAASSASAASFFDNFESGLGNWSLSGDGAIRAFGGSNGLTLTNAAFSFADDPMSLNLSGNDPLSAGGALETAAGLPVGALDLSAINQATEGSILKRTFTIRAGETLSFDWQLQTRDVGGQDYAFLSIGGTLVTLGRAADATLTATGDYLQQTGVGHYEQLFTSDTTVTVAFGIADVGDYSTSSALNIDNVAVVPEPGTFALLGLTLAGGVGFSRRRRSAQA